MLVSVKLNLPKGVVEAYEAEGDLTQVLESRLVSAVSHTASKPIYINDEIRRKFDKLFGKNFSTATELYEAVSKLMNIKIGDVDVPLQPALLNRLRTRCFGQPFEDFVAQQTVRGLEEFVGMR